MSRSLAREGKRSKNRKRSICVVAVPSRRLARRRGIAQRRDGATAKRGSYSGCLARRRAIFVQGDSRAVSKHSLPFIGLE